MVLSAAKLRVRDVRNAEKKVLFICLDLQSSNAHAYAARWSMRSCLGSFCLVHPIRVALCGNIFRAFLKKKKKTEKKVVTGLIFCL